jgi:hypothetical protein
MAASAWFEESNKLTSVSRASNLPIVIPKAMLVTLRKRFENLHSRVSDKIYPCAYILEMRLEEVEERDPDFLVFQSARFLLLDDEK